jgi:hypothetical protein
MNLKFNIHLIVKNEVRIKTILIVYLNFGQKIIPLNRLKYRFFLHKFELKISYSIDIKWIVIFNFKHCLRLIWKVWLLNDLFPYSKPLLALKFKSLNVSLNVIYIKPVFEIQNAFVLKSEIHYFLYLHIFKIHRKEWLKFWDKKSFL